MVKGLLIYTVWERWQVAHIKQVLPVEIVVQIFILRFVLSEIASLKRILKQSELSDCSLRMLESAHIRNMFGNMLEEG